MRRTPKLLCQVISFCLRPTLVLSLLVFGLRAVCSENAENLLSLTSSGCEFPQGFKVHAGQEDMVHEDSKVFQGKAGPSIRFDLPERGNLWLDTSTAVQLEEGRKYLFSVRVKIQDMVPGGMNLTSKGVERGILMEVHSGDTSRNVSVWNAVVGTGSSEGWVTAMIPFDTNAKPDLAKVSIFLRCYDISGTVWFQDPVLIEVPDGFNMNQQFILENGDTVSGGILTLKN